MLVCLIGSFFFAVPAVGSAEPRPEARGVDRQFFAQAIITADPDWERKWMTPRVVKPQFELDCCIALGEEATLLVFFSGAALEDGVARLACSLRVTRADGTVAADVSDTVCFNGPLRGPATDIYLTGLVVRLVAEQGDPSGLWTIDLAIRDAIGDRVVPLQVVFEMVAE